MVSCKVRGQIKATFQIFGIWPFLKHSVNMMEKGRAIEGAIDLRKRAGEPSSDRVQGSSHKHLKTVS